jgi:uncharacterized protein YecT (DUF1311 family)
MRLAIAALWVLFVGVAHADPVPVWRMETGHLAADRETARNCLANGRNDCSHIVQDACSGPAGEEGASNALSRRCDWRAIAAWEDEMNASLAFLRAHLHGPDLARLNASQRAWNVSMLKDVGLGMDYYSGGSMAGPIGAHIRAEATAARAIYLDYLKSMVGEE